MKYPQTQLNAVHYAANRRVIVRSVHAEPGKGETIYQHCYQKEH